MKNRQGNHAKAPLRTRGSGRSGAPDTGWIWGRHAVLIHPRHERYEIAAAAAPEAMLIEARPTANDASKRSAGEDKSGPSFYVPGPAPDDPGASDGDI